MLTFFLGIGVMVYKSVGFMFSMSRSAFVILFYGISWAATFDVLKKLVSVVHIRF
jgi:hypothetical protein